MRLRLQFSKLDKVRIVGHRNLTPIVERDPVASAQLAMKPGIFGRSEIANASAPGAETGIARSTHQSIENEGQREEPLMPSNSTQLKEYKP
jgi:hypothetical protein